MNYFYRDPTVHVDRACIASLHSLFIKINLAMVEEWVYEQPDFAADLKVIPPPKTGFRFRELWTTELPIAPTIEPDRISILWNTRSQSIRI